MKKILLIENNSSVKEQIRNTLLNLNYQVLEASNGWQGLEMAIDEMPDLILSNKNLPQLTGTQLYNQIKKYPVVNKIPFVLISTHQSENVLQFIQIGSQTYILPETDVEYFANSIKNLMEPDNQTSNP